MKKILSLLAVIAVLFTLPFTLAACTPEDDTVRVLISSLETEIETGIHFVTGRAVHNGEQIKFRLESDAKQNGLKISNIVDVYYDRKKTSEGIIKAESVTVVGDRVESGTLVCLEDLGICMISHTNGEMRLTALHLYDSRYYNGLKTGDKISVYFDGNEAESNVPQTVLAIYLEKIADGALTAAEEEFLNGHTVLDSIDTQWEQATDEYLGDWSFSLTFGTYGISSYDSKSGRLVKTTDATHPEDYITEMYLSDQQLSEICSLLLNLNIESYPLLYDPINDPNSDMQIISEPSMTLILTVTFGESSRTITCKNIAHTYQGYDEKSQAFLDTCRRICEIITSTDEWQGLPDYEFYYE